MSWILLDDLQQDDDEYCVSNNDIFNIENNKEVILCVGKVQSGKTRRIFQCIKDAFYNHNYDFVILLGGTTTSLYEQTKERLLKENWTDEIDLYFNENIQNLRNRKNRSLITILKNKSYLKNVYDFLCSFDNIKDKKILIVDDESDYGSVNINEVEMSAIFKSIFEIYNYMYNGILMQVTATPFANIISNKSNIIKAQKVLCWDSPKEYFGLHKFDDIKSDKYEILDATKINDNDIKKSIRKVIKYFLTTIIKNKNIMDELEDVSCLINVDLKNDMHEKIYHFVNLEINNFEKNLFYYYSDFKNIFNSFNDFENTAKTLINNQVDIIILNSKNKKIINKNFNIYIGGTLLSRGNTFTNLICELMINEPISTKYSVDTLLQRCRWFGYRSSIIDYMKIFMSENIYNSLQEAKEYVDLLKPGIHDLKELSRKITIQDTKSIYVVSTRKE